TSGPSILAGTRPVNDKVGPGRRTGSVPDDPGDASYDANGTSTPASPNLDLTGASLGQDASGNLVVRIRVRSLASLAVSPTLGGANASWLARWVQVVPG